MNLDIGGVGEGSFPGHTWSCSPLEGPTPLDAELMVGTIKTRSGYQLADLPVTGFLDSRSAKNPKPNSAITLNSVNLYNTTGYALKEEDWNV